MKNRFSDLAAVFYFLGVVSGIGGLVNFFGFNNDVFLFVASLVSATLLITFGIIVIQIGDMDIMLRKLTGEQDEKPVEGENISNKTP